MLPKPCTILLSEHEVNDYAYSIDQDRERDAKREREKSQQGITPSISKLGIHLMSKKWESKPVRLDVQI